LLIPQDVQLKSESKRIEHVADLLVLVEDGLCFGGVVDLERGKEELLLGLEMTQHRRFQCNPLVVRERRVASLHEVAKTQEALREIFVVLRERDANLVLIRKSPEERAHRERRRGGGGEIGRRTTPYSPPLPVPVLRLAFSGRERTSPCRLESRAGRCSGSR
jgi:hypothetical protein